MITHIPTEIIHISLYDIKHVWPKESLEILKESVSKCPTDEEIRQIY